MKTSLYRFFDAEGRLLYVGATANPFRRLAEHSATRDIAKVVSVTLEWFPSRLDAVLAEDRAILSERPAWNIAKPAKPRKLPCTDNTPRKRGARPKFDPSKEQDARVLRLWGDLRYPPQYVLDRASEIVGMEVKRHHLTHRYGARVKKQ